MVVAPLTVVEAVWASAGAAQISADRLTIGDRNAGRGQSRGRAPEVLDALGGCGEKYPVI